jgi:hypothetical protein|tara:strand:+ start:105 stop:737 length:633 start_codon:yes stop_codon:yes gene_type:complete
MSIPQFPERGQNTFQDARRRGLAGVIGGALDNLTMGMTDFDKRGDSEGQKFLKEFIFGTEGKKMGDMGEPTMPVPGMPPLPEDFLDPTGDLAEKRNKSVTEKVDKFLDPTGDLAEKKLDTVKEAETGAKTINIGGKDYNVYTDQFTGLDFVPNDPRISTDPRDFNRHGQPLTEEQKKLRDSGVMFESSIPNPLSEEDQIRQGKENMKINF